MAIKPMTGLYRQPESGIYHIDKRINGKRVHQSTRTTSVKKANQSLQAKINLYEAVAVSNSFEPTFRDGAVKYILISNQQSLDKKVQLLAGLYPYLADKPLRKIRKGMLESFINDMYAKGSKSSTINIYLQLVRSILKKAADEWIWPGTDDPWINYAPKIPMERVADQRKGHPITWAEQRLLIPLLPEHLEVMVLFALNTGLRADSELCQLRWSWEHQVPGSKDTYFLIPAEYRKKNLQALPVILNSVARNIIESRRKEKSSDFVFTYNGNPVRRINNRAWVKAKERAIALYPQALKSEPNRGFLSLNVHDLRHTFATRLRNMDVSEEDIAVMLGHKSTSVTDLYSHARYSYILEKVEKIATEPPEESPTIRQLSIVN